MTMARREALLFPAALRAATAKPFRLAICSETFPGMEFPEICAAAKRTGYTGLEIDPSNLSPDPAALTRERRATLRRHMEDAGLTHVGLHSFLKTPPGLHLTAPDSAVRQKSWDYFARLIDLCADLGPDSLMVLGSAKQRSGGGLAPLEEGLARMAPLAAARGVTVVLEPLGPGFTDNVNTIAQAVEIIERTGSPGLRTMLDTHHLTAETEPHASLIPKHLRYLRHIHLNEMDGRYPGSGKYDFAAFLAAARKAHYAGWLSVELFDFQPDGETVARRSAEFVRGIERRLG
ncbi:MAG: sugar phosphate isomerase/epimerase family protein [Bryobacteraceae bacterium]|nr:sugar phosphate isomerase/epimerase family protein [Bryobacteraceae bacterium]